MSQAKPLPWHHTPSGELLWRVISADLPRGEPRSAMAKLGEREGWSAVWSSSLTGWEKYAQFKLKMASDVLLPSYLDKIGISLMGEAGQASAYLDSEARLYKGASLALLSQSATTRSTGNISVQTRKPATATHVEQWVLCSFPLKISAALCLHFQHLMKTKG